VAAGGERPRGLTGSATEADADRVFRASDLPDAFGMVLAPADTDGDGVDELVAAAPYDGAMGEEAGVVYLLELAP
jgi:hypothetical protein